MNLSGKNFFLVFIGIILILLLFVYGGIPKEHRLAKYDLTSNEYQALIKKAINKGDVNAFDRLGQYFVFYKHDIRAYYDLYKRIADNNSTDNAPLIIMCRATWANLYRQGRERYHIQKNLNKAKYYQKIAAEYILFHCNEECYNKEFWDNVVEGSSPSGSLVSGDDLSSDTPCIIVKKYINDNPTNLTDIKPFESYLKSHCI